MHFVFFTKNIQTGFWNISAVTSFEAEHNLFVENGHWQAAFKSNSMKTFPFYLMNSPKGDNSYTIGINEKSSVFSSSEGEAIFEQSGKASLLLSQVKTLLETDIENSIQTYQFGQALNELGLFKSINILVRYQDDSLQTLQGLYTIDEDKLQRLSAEQLETLNKKGYLTPIHAMLVSIFQLNALIQRNNNIEKLPKIKNIKLEINKA